MIRPTYLSCALLVLAAAAFAQAPLTINGIADRTTYTDTASFNVPVTPGYSYSVSLDGEPVPAVLTNVVTKMDYHEVSVWRTNMSTLSVSNRVIRFVVLSSQRGSPERGLTMWVPYPPIPSTASEFAGANLRLVTPAAIPTGVEIPMIGWVDDGNDRVVRGNGWVSAPGFESSAFRIVRGHGFGMLPAQTQAGPLSYAGSMAGLSTTKQINIEANTSWATVSGILTENTTWPANSRVSVIGNLTIPAGLTLTIGEGTIVRLNARVNITNTGALRIDGTLDNPVVFTPTGPVAPHQHANAWGGIIMRGSTSSLIANGAIMAGAGGATSFSFSPGASHRSEQALLLVHSGARAMLTNCFLINQAGQIANGYNSDITYDHCLLQRAITSGESVGGTIILNKSACIEFPSIDGVYNATIADSDYDGIYFTTGTHILSDTLFGFCKDDAVDSGSGGAGTVLVTNCWVESALHEALAWSGGGRVTWTYDTVLMNSGQGIEAGWTEGSTVGSPNVFADRLFTTANSVGARFGDNYDWSYLGYLKMTNSLILYNYRDVFAKTWNTSGSSWDTNRWVDRLAQMDLRSNYLTEADSRFPSNIVWNPAAHASKVAPFMSVPAAASIGIGLAVWTNQFAMATIFDGIPVRLSSFTIRNVSVDYTIAGPSGTLTTGTLTFEPGETLKRIYPSGFNLQGQTPVTVTLSNPQSGEITGVSQVSYIGSAAAPGASLAVVGSQLGMERITEGVPVRLTAPAAHTVTIGYQFETPGGLLSSSAVTFAPGETLAWIPAPPIAPVQYDIVRLAVLGSTGASFTGSTNLTFVKSEVAEQAPANSAVARGAAWKYLDNGTDQGTGWRALSFADNTWSNGVAQLGFSNNEENDETTLIRRTVSGVQPTTYYFRSKFVITNTAAYTNLSMWLLRDDGAVVYLNGSEVYRTANMPAGAISYNTFTTATGENSIDTATLSITNLVNGTNIVAVEVHQRDGTSSDVSFDFELIANPIAAQSGTQHLFMGLFGGDELILGWNDATYRLEEANTVTGVWNTVVSPSPVTISPTNEMRFYRLRQ